MDEEARASRSTSRIRLQLFRRAKNVQCRNWQTDSTYRHSARPVLPTLQRPYRQDPHRLINSGTVAALGTTGAYNIFLPPGTTASLSGDLSCNSFCDYHDSANGPNGPFYTVEPYPCAQGCNQCT